MLYKYTLTESLPLGATSLTINYFAFPLISRWFHIYFLIMYLVVNVFSLHYSIGEVVITLVIPIINFILNNYCTFK
jgi:hypothetical protein